MAKTRISKLRVNEVSLVDRPANPAARVVLAKQDDDFDPDFDDGDAEFESEVESEIDDTLGKALEYGALLDVSVEAALADESLTKAERIEFINKTVDQFRDSVLALDTQDTSDAETTATINKRNAEMADKTEDVLKAERAEEIAKAVEAANKPLLEKIAKAEKETAEMRETIAKRDRLEKAKGMVGGTAVDPQKVADVLEKMGDNADTTAFIADLLAKYDVSIKAGAVLQEIGGSSRDLGTTDDELKKAIELVKAADPKLTPEQAFAKAIQQNPKLYEKSLTK